MKIGIVTPAPAGSTHGNRITALRWAKILKRLGYRVFISQTYKGESCDLLIALHARRSYRSIERFHRERPEAPIIVALTGTDLYGDIASNRSARASLGLATRIVVLQPKALEELVPTAQVRARVIYQSVEPFSQMPNAPSASRNFDVCVIGHLRAVKDPFRAALAARSLPASSRIRILQIGGAMTKAMAARAQAEMRRNPLYQWLGEQTPSRVRRILASCQLCVISSRMEGGANVISEAIMEEIPILASRVDGNVGILGPKYPGLFNVTDTRELASLLQRAESDADFRKELRSRIKELAPLFDPKREQNSWAELLRELGVDKRKR